MHVSGDDVTDPIPLLVKQAFCLVEDLLVCFLLGDVLCKIGCVGVDLRVG